MYCVNILSQYVRLSNFDVSIDWSLYFIEKSSKFFEKKKLFCIYKQHFNKQRQAEIDEKSTLWSWILAIWKSLGKLIGHILKISKKQACLYSRDYTINHNENEDENKK